MVTRFAAVGVCAFSLMSAGLVQYVRRKWFGMSGLSPNFSDTHVSGLEFNIPAILANAVLSVVSDRFFPQKVRSSEFLTNVSILLYASSYPGENSGSNFHWWVSINVSDIVKWSSLNCLALSDKKKPALFCWLPFCDMWRQVFCCYVVEELDINCSYNQVCEEQYIVFFAPDI